MTYEPEHLRFFQARFEPLAPYPRFEDAFEADRVTGVGAGI